MLSSEQFDDDLMWSGCCRTVTVATRVDRVMACRSTGNAQSSSDVRTVPTKCAAARAVRVALAAVHVLEAAETGSGRSRFSDTAKVPPC